VAPSSQLSGRDSRGVPTNSVFLITYWNLPPYESNSLQGVVVSLIYAFTVFAGVVFGLLSVILGIIARIKINKGVYKRSQNTVITVAMILGTLGILLGILPALASIAMWLYGTAD
jgi:hypothetical protein